MKKYLIVLSMCIGPVAYGQVSSWAGRTGAVLPMSGDYSYAQISGKPVYNITDLTPTPCTGTGNDTSAIQGLIDSVTGRLSGTPQNGAEIDFPKTGPPCRITELFFSSGAGNTNGIKGLVVKGGPIKWIGATDGGTVFEIQSCSKCLFEDFEITAATNIMGVVFDIQQLTNLGTSTTNMFVNNLIDGGGSNRIDTCFTQSDGGPGDIENDQMVFIGNTCRFYRQSMFEIDDNQYTDDTMIGNFALGVPGSATSGQAVLDSGGAAFNWTGGQVIANSVADFNITSATESGTDPQAARTITIQETAGEDSKRFVLVNSSGSPSGVQTPISLIDNSIESNLMTDANCVSDYSPGPLNVIGGSYGLSVQGNNTNPCDFLMSPDLTTVTAIYGQIVGVTSSGKNSAGTPLLAVETGVTANNVLVANNTYTGNDDTGHAVAPSTAESANFAGSIQAGDNISLCGLSSPLHCDTLTGTFSADNTITVPDFSGTLVTTTGTQALSNKTLTGTGPSGNNVTLMNIQGVMTGVVGNGSAQTIYSYSLPANTLNPTGCIRVTTMGTRSSTDTMAMTFNVGSVSISGGSATNTGEYTGNFLYCNTSGTGAGSQVIARPYAEYGAGMSAGLAGGLASSASQASTGSLSITFQFNAPSTTTYVPHLFLVELVQ